MPSSTAARCRGCQPRATDSASRVRPLRAPLHRVVADLAHDRQRDVRPLRELALIQPQLGQALVDRLRRPPTSLPTRIPPRSASTSTLAGRPISWALVRPGLGHSCLLECRYRHYIILSSSLLRESIMSNALPNAGPTGVLHSPRSSADSPLQQEHPVPSDHGRTHSRRSRSVPGTSCPPQAVEQVRIAEAVESGSLRRRRPDGRRAAHRPRGRAG